MKGRSESTPVQGAWEVKTGLRDYGCLNSEVKFLALVSTGSMRMISKERDHICNTCK